MKIRHHQLLIAIAALGVAQRGTAQAAGAPPAGYVMHVETRERWMNARQRPAFTAFVQWDDDLTVDSLRAGPAPGGRTLWVRVGRRGHHGTYAHDANGRVVRVDGVLYKDRRVLPESVADSIRGVRFTLFADDFDRTLALPAARLWDLVPSFQPTAPRRGAAWSDSLDLSAEFEGYRQSLAGRRVSRVVKDTTVSGRRMWIVADSAAVRYAETALHDERTLDTTVTVARVARGAIRGRHLYDPALRLFWTRADTTALAGEATLRYPDGRGFRSPTRFERTRAWALLDSAGQARRDSLEAEAYERGEGGGGMGAVVVDDAGERVMNGDRTAIDSLITAWRRSRTAEERDALIGTVAGYARIPADSLAALALADGDTAYALRELPDRFYSTLGNPITEPELRRLLPLMDDPGVAFAFGLDRDPAYENAVQGLAAHPPAVTPEHRNWPCTPAACQLLAAQWGQAREPRLRDVGLAAAAMLDPRHWADTLLAHAPAATPVLADVVRLVRGTMMGPYHVVGPPVPPPGAGWREWRAWIGRRTLEGGESFNQPHQVAIRYHERLTGRDVLGELRRARAEAVDDSARLVFATLLMAFGERGRTPGEVHQALAHGSAADRELATRELGPILDAAPPADTATTTALLGRMLEVMTGNAARWRPLVEDRPWPPFYSEYSPVFALSIDGEKLSPALIERWRTRARVVMPGDTAGTDPRRPAFRFEPVTVARTGPFARVHVRWHARGAIKPGQQTAGGSMGAASVDLVLVDGEWRMVNSWSTIT